MSTTQGSWRARIVVLATGGYHKPNIPALSAQLASHILQLHTDSYRNPVQLPEGAVLFVGTGQSCGQIAEELLACRGAGISGDLGDAGYLWLHGAANDAVSAALAGVGAGVGVGVAEGVAVSWSGGMPCIPSTSCTNYSYRSNCPPSMKTRAARTPRGKH